MKRFGMVFLALTVVAVLLSPRAEAAIMTFNSSGTGDAAATRTAWLAAIGIASPQYLVDFETGFSNGQNVSGQSSLFPYGMIITDTNNAHQAIIRSGNGVINGSNTVGFTVTQNEEPYLKISFSNPVDYVGLQDIDHSNNTFVRVTFENGSTYEQFLETTGVDGDTAEFYGVFRNDMSRISKVEFDATGDGLWGIDNIEYGRVPSSQVPEPTAILLLGLGLAGIARIRRHLK